MTTDNSALEKLIRERGIEITNDVLSKAEEELRHRLEKERQDWAAAAGAMSNVDAMKLLRSGGRVAWGIMEVSERFAANGVADVWVSSTTSTFTPSQPHLKGLQDGVYDLYLVAVPREQAGKKK